MDITTINIPIRIAPPDKASCILRSNGYPISAKCLRTWAKNGTIPAVWTGRKMLINIEKTVMYLNAESDKIAS